MENSQTYELSREPLGDLLLALEATKSSIELSLNSSAGHARLSVHEGRLDDATFGDKSGSDAVLCMLALREGRYSLSARSARPRGLNESLARIVHEKMRSSSAEELAQTGSSLSVSAPLERTSLPLPSGLGAIELRILAEVNRELSALDIAAQVTTAPAESLRALRHLEQLGLIRTGKRGTLALGTPIPATLRRAIVSRDPSDAADSNEQARTATSRDSVPARLRGPTSTKPRDSGYSSVPPPSLAEEQIQLPRGLRAPVAAKSNPPKERPSKQPFSETLLTASPEYASKFDRTLISHPQTDRPPSARTQSAQTQSTRTPPGRIQRALSAATVMPDEGLHTTRNFSSNLTETAMTSSRPRRPLANGHDLGPPRPKMESDDFGPDPLVVNAAKGQLRDSELPLPSSRLGRAALDQLDELNDAVSNSRIPRLPILRDADELSQDLTVPGSVPNPNVLPGGSTSSESDLPTVGRYEILARLKRGGMGSVYLCRLTGSAGFRRHFAMKVLHGHLARQEDALDSFFHEARVLGGLHHRNIVSIADVGTLSEPYLVLEYVEGGSLAELYRATPKGRDPRMVVAIVLDALAGLSVAHQATGDDGEALELVHCDVTPHNLLVGIDGTCRVTDFGIARTRATDNESEITRGKPGYVAPERLERKPSDHRSDLFSLGVVLYAGLTGCEPFAAESADQTMRNVLNKPVAPPSETGFQPPLSLDWICLKALARDPQERFQSADEMATQLQRVAAREGLLASATEVAEWVSESLAPTLAARRVASMRGTTTAEGRYQPSAIPPSTEDVGVAPAPSAIENTGPLDAPVSSRGFRDETEVLNFGPGGKADSATEASARLRMMAVYGALALAVVVLVWVVLSPSSVSGFLRMTPEAGQVSGVSKDGESPASSPGSAAPNRGSGEEKDQDDIVIPDIVPSAGEK